MSGDRPLRVRVSRAASRALRARHPWIWDTWVDEGPTGADATGRLVAVYDADKRFTGLGLWDAFAPIRVRMLSWGPLTWGPEAVAARVGSADAARAEVRATDTDGYRVVNGPNDGLPGVVIDRYADVAVVKVYSPMWAPWVAWLRDAALGIEGVARVVLRLARHASRHWPSDGPGDGSCLTGEIGVERVLFREHGRFFEAEPVRGQKTGFFLDQRDNRARVGALSGGGRVLNLFAYTGGFSVHAAAGGAVDVTSVDISPWAMEGAERNFDHNASNPNVARCMHRTKQSDVFVFLDDATRAGERWDVVVVDPPSFAKSAADVPAALRAYERLARRAGPLVAPGGVLVFASCSSRVGLDALREAAASGLANVRGYGTPWDETTHAQDHPARWDEFAYLKCLWYRRANDGG